MPEGDAAPALGLSDAIALLRDELLRTRAAGTGSEQKVTVVFGGPVDRDGNPVKVASASDALKG